MAVQGEVIASTLDTADLGGLELWFYDPRPPKTLRESMPDYIEETRRLRHHLEDTAPVFQDGLLGRVECKRAANDEAPFRPLFWPMTFSGLGITEIVARKASTPYKPGICPLVVSTLELSPGGEVAIPDLKNGTVEFVNDLDLARQYLAEETHPFSVVWGPILMQWEDGADSIAVLHGDERGLLAISNN